MHPHLHQLLLWNDNAEVRKVHIRVLLLGTLFLLGSNRDLLMGQLTDLVQEDAI